MTAKTTRSDLNRWVSLLLLGFILAAGAYLRFVGLDWDAEQHLHPDERFLTMVESSLIPVESFRDYFNTAVSTLNPNNQGHGFFVYGTLPIFLVRYLAEWLGFTGYGSVYLVGRSLSAVMDLLSVALIFFIGARLFNRKVGLLGAAFSSLAVLQIQQSHFFTVDTFITFFSLLAVYFAVEVVTAQQNKVDLVSYLFFGLALAMAVASKINAAPVAATLPLAALVHWLRMDPEEKNHQFPRILLYLALAALTSLIAFRIFQPYAFAGPGFFNFKLNESWVISLRSLHAQASGDVDFPPALQWARRPVWFSLKNMVLWGLGLPLGILSWLGFIRLGWKLFSARPWKPGLVIWAWTGAYFAWQSLQWNSTMRYQLPIYPLLALFAAWLLVDLWESLGERTDRIGPLGVPAGYLRTGVAVIGLLSLLLTGAWGLAFSRIYTTPHPRVAATRWIFANIPAPATLEVQTELGQSLELLSYPEGYIITEESGWLTNYVARHSGRVEAVYFPALQLVGQDGGAATLQVSLNDLSGTVLAAGQGTFEVNGGSVPGRIFLDTPLDLKEGETYQFGLTVLDPEISISLGRVGIANESSWDDGLPLRMDGYDPYGGIYQGGLNLELYWDDNQEKLDRFLTTLDQAEYLMITSSRQWATTTRVPERYPLTTEYYRQLMGCPAEITVEECYNKALPGTYQGTLGFDLITTFQSNPSLGPLEINDQPAEEAFTVYDHPKVFIFQKSAAYDAQAVADILSAVDLSVVMHVTPKQADRHPANLMLPPDRLAEQRSGGTWSEIFNPEALHNRSQILAALVWYAAVFLLGLAVYPLMRSLLPGLNNAGYPLARTFGLLLLSYLSWLAGSVGIPFQRLTILAIFALLVGGGVYLGYRQRRELIELWNSSQRYYLFVEALALALFIISLLIRFGNPDLWHPWKGGERPMDFSYFNAVLKSTSFPPYDPWFAGGYINYYYYGFVFVGALTKLLGIVPALAYNLILPTLFMMLGLGAFTILWNLLQGDSSRHKLPDLPYRGGIAGVVGMILLGNLGILRMIFQGLQRLASGGVNVLDGSFFQRLQWTFLGLGEFFQSFSLRYRVDEWYWNPSRVIGAEHGGPITEFPFFTFLYGDLHAHLIALPLTVLALAWILSIVKAAGGTGTRMTAFQRVGTALGGALVVSVLRPTNTWDFYPYLALGLAAWLYAWWRESRQEGYSWSRPALQLALFLAFAFLFAGPFTSWYGEGYTSIKPWFGSQTPVNDYLIHWGLFLFIIVSWMFVETIEWMAATPVSALRELAKARELIIASLLVLLVILISLGIPLENEIQIRGFSVIGSGVKIIWFALPLMAWALVLLLKPERDLMKGIVLFLIGTGLAITLMVELVYVEGDIGRMNTVFKFYLQAWTLLSISSAAALSWLMTSSRKPGTSVSGILWQVAFSILLAGAALYPLIGGAAKIKDRIPPETPRTLDGMAFMEYATYYDLDTALDLSQDYRAIRWMQDNVIGSPVIVEGNMVEYHWGTRYTVYTGLPGVIGWNWHQRQQRTITPHEWIFTRVEEVNGFYDNPDLGQAKDFLEKYQVSYIIVGQLERAKYLPDGIAKFEQADGDLWEQVYQDQDTVIYRTLPQ